MSAWSECDAVMCMRESCCEKVEKIQKIRFAATLECFARCNDSDTTISTKSNKY